MATILVVEDDTGTQDVIADALSNEGHSMLRADNGEAGVAIAKQYQPDLILMDLFLPVMNGSDAITHLREDPATQDIRIVAMSASGMLALHAFNPDVAGILPKPFDLASLVTNVAEHLSQHVGAGAEA